MTDVWNAETVFGEGLDQAIQRLYGNSPNVRERQRRRYDRIGDQFRRRFEKEPVAFFSAPGRTEIIGNHTDHNGGEVLAASISLDVVAAAAPNQTWTVSLHSEGFPEPFVVDLRDLSPRAQEKGTPALIRGVAAGFMERSYAVGGFDAYASSDILNASGLSSSAAIEMLLGTILSGFYNGGAVDPYVLAKIGQSAENRYWNKQSGLLDQLACGLGGLIHLDFRDRDEPKAQNVNFDFGKEGYAFLIVNTGGNHAHLTDEYTKVPVEMRAVANHFGKERCIELTLEQVVAEIPRLRASAGDRAVLRVLHFFAENERVRRQVALLERNDSPGFLDLVTASGSSSWRLLQNGYDVSDTRSQGIPLALALTERFLETRGVHGAYRVHGGGFAGVTLVILPEALVEEYSDLVTPVFGEGAVMSLTIREYGSVNVSALAQF